MLNDYDKEILMKDEKIYNLENEIQELKDKNEMLNKENKRLQEKVYELTNDKPNVKSMRHF